MCDSEEILKSLELHKTSLSSISKMPQSLKGVYILEMILKKEREIKIGAMGDRFFAAGKYFYVGSAQNGLKSRISRHLGSKKKFHWHIDYFLAEAEVCEVWVQETSEKSRECELASEIAKSTSAVPGFGASDCQCVGHLFI